MRGTAARTAALLRNWAALRPEARARRRLSLLASADHSSPLNTGFMLMLPDAELYSLPGESHLGGLGEAEAIMATMSELWDDYQKDRNKG